MTFQTFSTTGNGEKLIKTTSTSLFTLVFAKFANFVWVRPTTTMFIIQTIVETGTVCMINIVVVGLIKTKLANLANTKVKREVLVVFINFSPLRVYQPACFGWTSSNTRMHFLNVENKTKSSKLMTKSPCPTQTLKNFLRIEF